VSAGGSLLKLAALGVLVALVIAALAGMPDGNDDELRAARANARENATLLARGLSARIAVGREALMSLAESARLQSALREADSETLNRLAAAYRAAFPESLRLLIVPDTGLQPAPQAQPPMGYALVEQVRAAVSGGRSSIEAHLPGSADAHANLVVPVGADAPLGALVLSWPLAMLRDAVAPPEDAAVSLHQQLAAGVTELFSLGTADTVEVSVAVPGTPWSLAYRADVPTEPLLTPRRLRAAAGGLAGALLLLAAGWLLRRRLQQALADDSDNLRRLIRDSLGDRLEAAYPARTRELQAGFAAAVETLREPPPRRMPPATDGRAVTDTDTSDPAPAGLEVTELDAAEIAEHRPTSAADRVESPVQPAVDPSIFRAYDIRGQVATSLSADVVRALGQAIGSEAAARGQQDIVVGYDGRHSSPELAAALIEGLTAAGRSVIELGCVPTPVVYFATHLLGTEAGVIVTGSHNPPQYNGLKIVLGGEALAGDAIQALRRRLQAGDLVTGEGSSRRHDVVPDYIDRIASDITLHRPLRVVLDCGNGVAGAVAPRLFRNLGCEVDELFCEVDGDFPNHHPDPVVPANLDALIARIRDTGADLGLAFDGDGDRLGVVDNRGEIIWADRLMMLFARDTLDRNPGSDIIFDVKCTRLLASLISDHAGVPVMWKTGHSLIKQKLRETGAPLAGEMSGHIFFQERWYGFDDGLYAGARLLEILSMDPRDSAEIFAELPQGVSTPELRVDLAEGEAPELIEALLAQAGDLPDARVTTIDGLRLDLPDRWGLVRASNTQPGLVLRFEGDDEMALAGIQALFSERLRAVRPDLELPF
jgi:phosphomannomutase/phosphoglucomutase